MSAVRSVWSARITCRWMLYRHRRCGAVGSPILCRFRSARPPSAFCNSLRFSSTSSTPSPSSPSPRVREDTVRRLLDTCSNTSYHPLGVEPCKDLAVPTEGFREQLKQFWTGTKDMYHVGRQYFAIKWKSVPLSQQSRAMRVLAWRARHELPRALPLIVLFVLPIIGYVAPIAYARAFPRALPWSFLTPSQQSFLLAEVGRHRQEGYSRLLLASTYLVHKYHGLYVEEESVEANASSGEGISPTISSTAPGQASSSSVPHRFSTLRDEFSTEAIDALSDLDLSRSSALREYVPPRVYYDDYFAPFFSLMQHAFRCSTPINSRLIWNVDYVFDNELKFDHVPRGHLLLAASLLEPSVSASLRRLPSAALVRLLRRYASYIKEDDVRIMVEGGPEKLSDEELVYSCFRRGMDTRSRSRDWLRARLREWAELSLGDLEVPVPAVYRDPLTPPPPSFISQVAPLPDQFSHVKHNVVVDEPTEDSNVEGELQPVAVPPVDPFPPSGASRVHVAHLAPLFGRRPVPSSLLVHAMALNNNTRSIAFPFPFPFPSSPV